jgi:aconitate hydratase
MGVLPLEFVNRATRHTYKIDGSETFDVQGKTTPGGTMQVIMTRRCGNIVSFAVRCRLDTAEEASVYAAGGVLQKFAQDFLASSQQG